VTEAPDAASTQPEPLPEEELQRRVRADLDRIGLPYEWLEIDPAFADTARFCARYGHPFDRSANTILVATRREPRTFALCIVGADRKLDVNRAVRRALGVPKLSFASADDTVRTTRMRIGGVTPFALPSDLPILVDADLMRFDAVILGGGGRATKVVVSPEVFRRLPAARLVPGLSMPR